MRFPILFLWMACLCGYAQAGAWTEGAGQGQAIASLIFSSAGKSYDAHGAPGAPARFERLLLQTDTEYGVTDDLTAFLRTETANAHEHSRAIPINALDNAFEGGARWRITDTIGIVSIEAAYRTAGAFNFAVSADSRASGRAAGIRLLYGGNFKFRGMDGFYDIEAGQSWLTRPRPDENPLDLTAGLWLDSGQMVMLQSFNLFSAGSAAAPYVYFRSHKIELSWVKRLSGRFSLQVGGFFSPAGQNALVEQGLVLALWTRF
jgi:hypothetical protein